MALTIFLIGIYLANPFFVRFFNHRITDVMMASSPPKPVSGKVVVVDIDGESLARYGQWPWSRDRLAELLEKINAHGAASIALDMILAEPDRTSPVVRHAIRPEDDGRNMGLPSGLADHDAALARILAGGPFVLGFEFLFGDERAGGASCRLHPVNVIWVDDPVPADSSAGFFTAGDVDCSLHRLAAAVTYSGFLNATPDSDGILRRAPLLIRYGNRLFPCLALASLLRSEGAGQIRYGTERYGRRYAGLARTRIPVDLKGNMAVNFAIRTGDIRRVSAADILGGGLGADVCKGRFVIVGLSASGLKHTYQTPVNPVSAHADIHAQVLETILTDAFIVRGQDFVLWESLFGMAISVLFSLCILRLGFAWNAAIAVAAAAGIWQGANAVFRDTGFLFSPLLPLAVLPFDYAVLTIVKYWKSQLEARRTTENTLVLLKASEQKLNTIIQTIPDIVFLLDPAGRITFVSRAIRKYETEPGALIGQPILDLIIPEDRTRAVHKITERRTGVRATSAMELRMVWREPRKGEAEFRYFSVSAEGVYREENSGNRLFIGTQGIARDITDQKKIEHQLQQAQKMQTIGNLAAGVAHDLNNVLGGLVTYPELLLLELPPDSPLRSKIALIQRSGQKAASMVQDLLTLARRGVSVDEIFQLNTVIRDYLASPEFDAIRRHNPKVRVETRLSDELLNVKGSPVHLSKVLMNLIHNSVEAMPAGGCILLTTDNIYVDAPVTAYETIPEGEYVRLGIADEGVGIAREDLKRIFDPFYSKKVMGKSGSGLGMTVVWASVKDHGGYIDLQSREGEGTRFDIYLPATRQAAGEKSRPIVLEDYVGTESVLVIDDIPEQREIAAKFLGKLGYRVETAPSGETAVEYLKGHPVDLLVLDMIMPGGMDGLETYRKIIANHPGQKAIITSGYSESGRVRELQQLGAGDYVQKPYTLEKIGVAVRGALDRR
ncbi:MAG: CHASE2 domain-containing protein [Thermodesulfobacteriota bacterium]